jgi:hypothetical protein
MPGGAGSQPSRVNTFSSVALDFFDIIITTSFPMRSFFPEPILFIEIALYEAAFHETTGYGGNVFRNFEFVQGSLHKFFKTGSDLARKSKRALRLTPKRSAKGVAASNDIVEGGPRICSRSHAISKSCTVGFWEPIRCVC